MHANCSLGLGTLKKTITSCKIGILCAIAVVTINRPVLAEPIQWSQWTVVPPPPHSSGPTCILRGPPKVGISREAARSLARARIMRRQGNLGDAELMYRDGFYSFLWAQGPLGKGEVAAAEEYVQVLKTLKRYEDAKVVRARLQKFRRSEPVGITRRSIKYGAMFENVSERGCGRIIRDEKFSAVGPLCRIGGQTLYLLHLR